VMSRCHPMSQCQSDHFLDPTWVQEVNAHSVSTLYIRYPCIFCLFLESLVSGCLTLSRKEKLPCWVRGRLVSCIQRYQSHLGPYHLLRVFTGVFSVSRFRYPCWRTWLILLFLCRKVVVGETVHRGMSGIRSLRLALLHSRRRNCDVLLFLLPQLFETRILRGPIIFSFLESFYGLVLSHYRVDICEERVV